MCRLCRQRSPEMTNIFVHIIKDTTLAQLIHDRTADEPTVNDTLSNSVCPDCALHLVGVYTLSLSGSHAVRMVKNREEGLTDVWLDDDVYDQWWTHKKKWKKKSNQTRNCTPQTDVHSCHAISSCSPTNNNNSTGDRFPLPNLWQPKRRPGRVFGACSS